MRILMYQTEAIHALLLKKIIGGPLTLSRRCSLSCLHWNAVRGVPTNQHRYIIVTGHANTGALASNSEMTVPSGAAAIVIGAHPATIENPSPENLEWHRVYEPGQVVISDNASASSNTRVMRARGGATNAEGSTRALVLRNIIVQQAETRNNSAGAVPAGTRPPEGRTTFPATGTLANGGGGGAVEQGAHLILCRGGVIRNSSTQNSGAIHVQAGGGGGRFTMMPGSSMHYNVATAGGAVQVDGNATLIMHGGVLRDNRARGIGGNRAEQRPIRGNGGAVNLGLGNGIARMVMYDGILENNIAGGAGGAINIGTDGTERGELIMHGGSIRNNEARGSVLDTEAARQNTRSNGGAIAIQSQSTFVMNCGEIYGNTASFNTAAGTIGSGNNQALAVSNGGGIFVNGAASVFTMNGGTIRSNRAVRVRSSDATTVLAGNGGGVYVAGGGRFNMHPGATISGNIATAEQGATPLGNIAITANNARNTSNGGGVFVSGSGSTFNMYGGRIEGNFATRTLNSSAAGVNVFAGNGGGVYIAGGAQGHMYDGVIAENIAETAGSPFAFALATGSANMANGGGVFISGTGSQFYMHGGRVRGNRATNEGVATGQTVAGNGGGIYAADGGTFTINEGVIAENQAHSTDATFQRGNGGGAFVRGGTINLAGGYIVNHNVSRHGGGLFVSGGTAEVSEGVIIAGNNSETNGGGIAVEGPGAETPGAPTQQSILNITTGGIVSGNSAQSYGGGVLATGPRAGFGLITGALLGDDGRWDGHNEITLPGDLYGEENITFSVGPNRADYGGGISLQDGAMFTMGFKATSAQQAFSQNSDDYSSIRGNIANHSGGGIHIDGSESRLNMPAGSIRNNEARGTALHHGGGGVYVAGNAIFTLSGTGTVGGEGEASNKAGRGGGVFVHGGRVNMSGGIICNNIAEEDGGGVYMHTATSAFSGSAGAITNNIANDGGGLFVPHENLSNITIKPEFVFIGNVARNGLGIDNPLAERQRADIDPSTISITEWLFVDEIPTGSGNFGLIKPHVFTNYDINSTGPHFWRVNYVVGAGEGEVMAEVGQNRFQLPNGYFVPDGTELIFDAEPTELFRNWEVWTREYENSEEGEPVNFGFQRNETDNSLRHIVRLHTNMVGNFRAILTTTTLAVSKTVTGEFANRIQEFEFTIFLQDSNGDPLEEGSQFDFAGSRNGILTLDEKGSASFWLAHDQIIYIEEVPLDGYMQVVETPIVGYSTSFIAVDNEGEDVRGYGNVTPELSITEGRSVYFTNDRVVVPPTGLNLGNFGAIVLLTTVILLLMSGVYVAKIILRRRGF